MGSQTPIRALPYPVGTDRLMDGDDAIKALATSLDTQLGLGVGCRVGNTAVQNIAINVEVLITFNAVSFDTGNFFNPASSTIITCRQAGMYLAIVGYSFAGTAGAGSRIVILKVNGTSVFSSAVAFSTGALSGTLLYPLFLSVGDTVSMAQYQSSGATITTHNQPFPSLAIVR
jgi:hypothetical protein